MVKISVQTFMSGLVGGGQRMPFFLAEVSEDRKNHIMQKYQVPAETLALAESMDPSDGLYLEWLVKCIKKGQIAKEDSEKIKTSLEKFKRLKNSPAFKEKNSADINRYDPITLFEALDAFGDSKKQEVRDVKTQGTEGVDIVYQDALWRVYRVTSSREASILGSGTNWCTTQISTAQRYIHDGPLWIFYKDEEPYAQLHIESNQLMNRVDRDFRKGKTVRDQSLYDVMEKVQDPAMVAFVGKLLPMVHPSERYLSILKTKGPQVMLQALKGMMIDRYPSLEPEIFSLALGEDYISAYLSHFEKRDPEVEKTIVDKPAWASVYALYVLKTRWMEAEPAILKNKDKFSSCALYAVTFSVLDISSLSQLAKVLPKIKGRSKPVESFLLSFEPKAEKNADFVTLATDYMKRASFILEPLITKFLSKPYTSLVAESWSMKEAYSNLAGLFKQRRVINDDLTKLLLSKKYWEDNSVRGGDAEYLIFAKGPGWYPPKGMEFDLKLLDPTKHFSKMIADMEESDLAEMKLPAETIQKNLEEIKKRLSGGLSDYASFYVRNDFFDPSLMPRKNTLSLWTLIEDNTEQDYLSYVKKYMIPYIYSGKATIRDDEDPTILRALDLEKIKDPENLGELYSNMGALYDEGKDLKLADKILDFLVRFKLDFFSMGSYTLYKGMDRLMNRDVRWPAYEKYIKLHAPNPRDAYTRNYLQTYKKYIKWLDEKDKEAVKSKSKKPKAD